MRHVEWMEHDERSDEDVVKRLRARADEQERCNSFPVDRALDRQAADEIERLRAALEQIERWDGFPETGKFWDREKTRPVSYGAQWGSNGERDFMRDIARATLNIQHREGET